MTSVAAIKRNPVNQSLAACFFSIQAFMNSARVMAMGVTQPFVLEEMHRRLNKRISRKVPSFCFCKKSTVQ